MKNGIYTTLNGMNLKKSRLTPSSRYTRVKEYLRINGPSTKAEIIRNVFGKTVVNVSARDNTAGEISRGWGTYLWSLMVKNNDVKKERVGRRVYYSV
jgi:hypothetical protein